MIDLFLFFASSVCLAIATCVWAKLLANTVPFISTVVRFLAVFLIFGIVRVFLGIILGVIYIPIFLSEPFEYQGPVWSDFLQQSLSWVVPFVLYTVVLVSVPIFVNLLSTSFQGHGKPLKQFIVNGATNSFAIALFEAFLVARFMMTLLYIPFVPYQPTNAVIAAGGNFFAYVFYFAMIAGQAIFIFLVTLLTGLWLVWGVTGWRYADSKAFLFAAPETEEEKGAFTYKVLTWTAVDTRIGQCKVIALSALCLFVFCADSYHLDSFLLLEFRLLHLDWSGVCDFVFCTIGSHLGGNNPTR